MWEECGEVNPQALTVTQVREGSGEEGWPQARQQEMTGFWIQTKMGYRKKWIQKKMYAMYIFLDSAIPLKRLQYKAGHSGSYL